VIYKAFKNNLVGGDTLRIFQGVEKKLKRNANARSTIITPGQFKDLMENLPPHVRAILATAFYTGMRRGEILSLTWPRVDMESRVIRLEAKNTKDRESRKIPICEELYQVFRELPRDPYDDHVFLNQGAPVNAERIRNFLMAACKAAGIGYGRKLEDGFVFHDLRHCFNTYMRKAGVSESVIMRMTGHSSREMFDRYNKVDEDDMKIASAKMRDFLKGVDQTVDQTWN
jgi:integrase